MLLGHFAVGFAARRWAPEISLGTWFLAAQLADLLWPTLVLLGIEQVEVRPGATATTPLVFVHYPWSHSLLALAVWGAVLGLAWRLIRRAPVAAATALGAVVVSHWVLDWVTHRPDLPIVPWGTTRVGLGLWNHPALTLVVELGLFVAGVFLYLRATRPRGMAGRLVLGGLVALLAAAHLANTLGTPPPTATAVAWGAQGIWLPVALGYWADRTRAPVGDVAAAPAVGVRTTR